MNCMRKSKVGRSALSPPQIVCSIKNGGLKASRPTFIFSKNKAAAISRPPQIVRTAQKEALCKIIKF